MKTGTYIYKCIRIFSLQIYINPVLNKVECIYMVPVVRDWSNVFFYSLKYFYSEFFVW